jgi:phage terminase large subunit
MATAPIDSSVLSDAELAELVFRLEERERHDLAAENERKRLAEGTTDPVRFVREWLQSDVWDTQERILQSIEKRSSKTAVKACHSSGKTYVAALAVLWFLARFDEAIVVTTAPTAKQVEKMLWGDIHSALARSKYPYPVPTLTELKFGPKRYAMGFTTSVTKQDEGVKFQGFHAEHMLVILDEAPGVDPKIWDAIEGARAGGDVRILALGNPTIASGTFHEAFHTGRDSWKTFSISAFDTPNLAGISLTYTTSVFEEGKWTEKVVTVGDGKTDLMDLSDEELDINSRTYLTTRRWVKERWIEWGEGHPLWESRVLGQFPTQAEDALISLAWLEAAKRRVIEGWGKVKAGLDVAGPGEDETVLTIRRGPQILLMKSWASSDPRGEVVAALRPYKAELEEVNVDSIGVGWGMYQHLLDLKFPAKAVNVGEAPRDSEKYKNLKAELYWGLRMRLAAGDIAGLTDERAIGQLAGIRYKQNARGQVEIESKDDARKRGVKSPDRAESVMLAFAERTIRYGLTEYVQQEVAKTMAKQKARKNIPANATPEDIQTHQDNPTNVAKIDVDDKTVRCVNEECRSTFLQRTPGGKRCGACGMMQPKQLVNMPATTDFGLVRK